CLMLMVQRPVQRDRGGKEQTTSAALEGSFLAADSPPVRLPPGTLVRISGWVKVAEQVAGSPDGVLIYDDAGGEELAYRVLSTAEPDAPKGAWRPFHLYRR